MYVVIESMLDQVELQLLTEDVEWIVEDVDKESQWCVWGASEGVSLVGVRMVMDVGMHVVCVLYDQS